ncbi:hypothetical protein LARV_03207 [Longilinea arvoryzae]|uniref:FtsK domain-containing protein n=1 Tax=Longilinea arvoryzae TaxID=360412 RepID=A0A0S7BI49_9CHLR|nr:hypothetical protein [Longilinea arvoryzae]GAP15421.1 hypothetical protein LARV_03207 [Longilinea arvoryzae]
MAVQNLPQIKGKTIRPLNFQVAPVVEIANPFATLSLEEILQRHPYLPESTAVLGVCEDGLPILLDLTDPNPGSVLVGSTHIEGSTRLLQTALLSTLICTTANDLNILVVSRDPSAWQPFQALAGQHILEILPVFDRASGPAILRFSRILDQRMNGRTRGGIHLLLVDDIDYLNRVDFDVQINFQWFAKEGARHRMWTLAAIQPEKVEQNDPFIGAFRTRILGYVNDPFHSTWLANTRPPDTGSFHPTQQFCVRIQRNWMNFWLPGR